MTYGQEPQGLVFIYRLSWPSRFTITNFAYNCTVAYVSLTISTNQHTSLQLHHDRTRCYYSASCTFSYSIKHRNLCTKHTCQPSVAKVSLERYFLKNLKCILVNPFKMLCSDAGYISFIYATEHLGDGF